MFDDFEGKVTGAVAPDEAFQLLQELENSQSEEIRRQRAHFRITAKITLVAQPGNSSDKLKFKVQGVTGDLSESGLGAMFPVPLGVGDIYRLVFDTKKFALPMTFARCVRCHMVREDAFEVGMSFFAPIALPAGLESVSVRS